MEHPPTSRESTVRRSATAVRPVRGWWQWVDPWAWGIPVRSALVAAAVVLLASLAMAVVVLTLLHRQLRPTETEHVVPRPFAQRFHAFQSRPHGQ